MKEELLRILNIKLDDIKINIESLTRLNKEIEDEENSLSYIKEKLNKFKENEKYNILNFSKFSNDEFKDLLNVVSSDISDIFKTKNCNYEGLVYLINGINNGVSLSLTIEQENAINYLINGMEDVMKNNIATIEGLDLVKTTFAISDISVLQQRRNTFEKIISNLNDNLYIDEIDDVVEAITFNKLDASNMNEILSFLLKYNADIYNEEKESTKNIAQEKTDDYGKEDEVDKQEEISVLVPHEEENKNVSPVIFENNTDAEDENNDEVEFHLPEFNTIKDDIKEDNSPTSYNEPFVPVIDVDATVPSVDEITIDNSFDKNDNNEISENETVKEVVSEENPQDTDLEKNIDNDFNDIIPEEDYEEYNSNNETISIMPIANEKTSTREIQRLFQDFDISYDDSELSEYIDGNVDEYRKIIKVLKDNNILDNILKDKKIFKEILVNSRENEIVNVLNIIRNYLSVDNEDYETTVNIVADTMPSIFVSTGGNYENFIENVKLFRELGINLVNLFDFSKEVLIANHDTVLENYNIVKEYNISIDDKNAKYFLLLDNIGERIDYYVESVYKDENKGDTFDGYNFIKEYSNKLNVVTDETIKRLRYSSANGKKVFGSKPNSLAGEITNLKVNVLDIPEEYMNNFFDNNFDEINKDEVRQYAKLCKSSSNVGDYLGELSYLEKYHDNIRYDINGIKISYNKVVRCYNTLRSYGIDASKAVEFAVCYNLIITKDEYQDLKKILKEGVGE